MLEGTGLDRFLRSHGIVDHRVTHVAIVRDYLAVVAHVFAIMTTEATVEIKMSDVIRMGLPVGLHLREKIRLKNSLDLFHRAIDRGALLRVDVRIFRAIELIQARGDLADRFVGGRVRPTERFDGLSF